MYDAWAAYDPVARGYLFKEKVQAADPVTSAKEQEHAVSRAAFALLRWRCGRSAGSVHTMTALEAAARSSGLAPHENGQEGLGPDAIGNRVAAAYIAFSADDGALEHWNYVERPRHVPVNPTLDPARPGLVRNPAAVFADPDRWQPLFVDGATQRFLTPHWPKVQRFGSPNEPLEFDGLNLRVPTIAGGQLEELRSQVVELVRFNSWCTPDNAELVDASPRASQGAFVEANPNSPPVINPFNGRPYETNLVKRGDLVRAVAEYWSDGPGSDTPPGHWNAIARAVALDVRTKRQPKLRPHDPGSTTPPSPQPAAELNGIQWDVKLAFVLNAALHDAAIAAWDLKVRHDTARPITLVRWMGGNGQCSDRSLPSFHEQGLPLIPNLIELVTAESTQAGQRHESLRGSEGQLAVKAWLGPARPQNQVAGVGWRLATTWMPYQPWDFTTPPFPGYVSGHSTFSRAAAEVLAAYTGSPYFPGGLREIPLPANTAFRADAGPSEPVRLQWATYFDAADQSGLSRRWGGIHVEADDLDGRRLGAQMGVAAWQRAQRLFGE